MGNAEALQGIEYTIYTFNVPDSGKNNREKWEKHDSRDDMNAAIKEAEKLFSSGKFQKVEVKQKYFDKKKNRNLDVTLKTFESAKKREINVFMILAFAVICGAAAFGLTYYFSK